MWRMLALISVLAYFAGCQSPSQNPFSGIGPATIPPPGAATPGNPPYYPPGAPPTTFPPTITIPGAAASSAPTNVPLSRTNISVAAQAPPVSSITSNFAADPADRQPIRVVEGPASKPAILARSSTPAVTAEPTSVSQLPGSRPPGSQPTAAGNYAPVGTPPAYNRTRGFPVPATAPPTVPARFPPTNGQSTQGFRADRNVLPAGYLQGGATFVESASAAQGEWRSR